MKAITKDNQSYRVL